jgi:hypothetical protein
VSSVLAGGLCARWLGHGGGIASFQLVPAAAKGPRQPSGAKRARERSRPRSGLDGERGRGRLPDYEAVPRQLAVLV